MCYEAELAVDRTPASVWAGRQFVAEILERWGFAAGATGRARTDEIVLVTSELLTNALRATAAPVSLRVEGHRDHVLVTVGDDSEVPAVARAAGPADTGGRGLAIVDALSTRWGTTPVRGTGKLVWSKMAIPATGALAEHCRV